MRLYNLLSGIGHINLEGIPDLEIKEIRFDSRKVTKGDLFVAERGYNTDGHKYIAQAVAAGAVAVVCEELPEGISEGLSVSSGEGVIYLKVPNAAIALGIMASNFYDNPSHKMKLVGVTGTNGKTTTATLLYEMAGIMGYKAGLLSTVCNYVAGRKVAATHTTPDPLEMNALMAEMVKEGCSYCFMEVSSHSAHQHRIAGLDFDGAIFSNITHDHLDYHKTFKNYIDAKKLFFDELKGEAFALTNLDDKNGLVMLQNTKALKRTYSCRTLADFNCKIIERHLGSTLIELDGVEVWTKFTGDFNAYNILAVYAASILIGFERERVLEAVSSLVPVSGRFETVVSKDGVVAIVDYAHTPDALENVLSTLQSLKHENRIISVVGAGGDRDKTKRPEMAEVSSRMSDILYLTSDNPRSEEPESIIDDMIAGVKESEMGRVRRIADRRSAIAAALAEAKGGDVVLIAGKGHEDYQEIKGVKHHFDDKEVVQEIFKL